MTETFISGENFQMLCDVYIGTHFINPKIAAQPSKHLNIINLNSEWNNPKLIFCYSNILHEFMSRIHNLKNPFVLLSHNGDENITSTFLPILEHPLLIQWYAQNPMIIHPKLKLLPIGIANSMWDHGNISMIQKVNEMHIPKTNNIYFYFDVKTNSAERESCKQIIINKGLPFGTPRDFESYLQTLAKCKFAICPPGNGIDSHRIWECCYFKTIPILLKSVFTSQLQNYIPCIVLDSWKDFDKDKIMDLYENLSKKFQANPFLDFQFYVSHIHSWFP